MIEVLTSLAVTGLFAVGGILFVFLIALAFMYNSLISKRNAVENTFASVDVMLKKRHDLIPNLISTVKGYMKHERGVFEKITELRASAIKPGVPVEEKLRCENQLTGLLKSLFVSVENYPQLKASENFMHLQKTMTELEEQISAARRAYNAQVLSYNNAVDMFPTNIIASLFRFLRKPFFEAESGEKTVPSVSEKLGK
ncbi:MAG: LemA family protein [Candidatus Altiarchaeota archaeon]|nr:LemA family protein [Candidatus Altiarchaeota archaeon]